MHPTSRTGGSDNPQSHYAAKIRDNIEAFLTKLRRGKFVTREHQSQSIVAARECAGILRTVVELYHEAETLPNSKSVRELVAGTSALQVSTNQVATLIRHVTRAGTAMQRGPYFKLLLTNVTRRVLSILRQSAEDAVATEAELEVLARDIIEDAEDEEDEEEPLMEDQDGETPGTRTPHSDDDDCDVQLEESMPSSTTNFLKSAQRSEPTAAERFQAGMKRATFTLTDEASHHQPQPRRALRSQHANTAEPSSLLSGDFMEAATPPKQRILARAPSIVGEVDVLRVKAYPVRFEEFIQRAMDGIRSFESELAYVTQELCKRAARQLHDLDTVITLGSSHSTMSFLLKATEDCRGGNMFKVIVLEGRPLRGANRLADALRERGVDVRVLPDSAAFAVMSTCTKVVIGVENVLANGGLLAPIGTHPLCIAAKHFSVPVMVVTMTLKMTPYYPSDALCSSLVKISRTQSEELPWSTISFPGDVLPLDEWADVDPSSDLHALDVANPIMEYVPPHLVTLFATNEGEYTVPQIHRIVRDNYNPEDAHI